MPVLTGLFSCRFLGSCRSKTTFKESAETHLLLDGTDEPYGLAISD